MDVSVYALRLLLSLSLAITSESRPSHPVLSYYELLHVSGLRHSVVSRTPRLEKPWTRQIHFHSLGRSFSLHLEPRVNLFSPKLSVHLVNKEDVHQPYSLNRYRFYQGHLIGDDNSSVAVSMLSESGSIIAHITTHNETYYLEPAHYHFGDDQYYHESMIAYRKSDLLQDSHLSDSVDYVVTPDSLVTVDFDEHSVEHQNKGRLLKRQEDRTVKNTCSMVVVADYRFYEFLRSSESNVIDTIVSRIDAADRLSFRPAEWIINADMNNITGQGLQIESIIIHTEPSSDLSHYNSIDNNIEIQDLLRRFSRNNWSGYCLAHLMTHRNFPSRKLGLAYIASANVGETGGLCSTRVLDANTRDLVTYNTGVSIVSSRNRLLLPSEAELVIAHEIGHSWGSPHDPGNDNECAFNYLMNEFAQDGNNPTHRKFSKCSLASVGRVLVNKATCFKERQVSTCGNFVLDEGEECDEGSLEVEDRESCCTSDCRLREGMNCSDVNHPCCDNCAVALAESKVCHVVGNVSRDCTALTTCDGISRYCPKPNQAEVNSRCTDGVCRYEDDSNSTVRCVSFCELEGMMTCACTGDDQCLECCKPSEDGECIPLLFKGELIAFPDGIFCSNGFCENGVCINSAKDFASQLWDVITALNINEYGQFIQENIVGFVLLVVTIFWVPGSCVFYYLCDVKKVWKSCLKRSSDLESPDSNHKSPVFVSQTSWTQVKPVEFKPLLSVDDDDTHVDEPEDNLPLPEKFKDYSSDSVVTTNNTTI